MDTEMCTKGVEQKQRHEMGEEAQSSTMVFFWDYIKTLEATTQFKYFGQILATSDNNWPAVVANL